MSNQERTKKTKSSFVAIVGNPNVGKSTLVNEIVGHKCSIVTHKSQTTRFQLRGIRNIDDTQLVLIDTPGLFKERNKFDRKMVTSAVGGAQDADVVVHMFDARHLRSLVAKNAPIEGLDHIGRVFDFCAVQEKPLIAVINKVDLIDGPEILPLISFLAESQRYTEIFPLSAKKGEGVNSLVNKLTEFASDDHWYFSQDQFTDMSMKLLCAETTREQLFLLLSKELPYAIHVETTRWDEQKDGSVKIDQVIYVEKKSHKPIVIGAGGSNVKKIGQRSRQEIQKILERKIHLFVDVKIDPDWSRNARLLSDMGLD